MPRFRERYAKPEVQSHVPHKATPHLSALRVNSCRESGHAQLNKKVTISIAAGVGLFCLYLTQVFADLSADPYLITMVPGRPAMSQTLKGFRLPSRSLARGFCSSAVYRSSSSTSSPSAESIASSFLSRFQSLGPQTRTQTLDANQLQLLSLTLNRPTLYADSPRLSNAPPPPSGTPLPPGYHLVYFTPQFLEGELGADGTDVSYNADAPFTRRMWAGGEVRWPRNADGQVNPLRVGQEVRETTKVLGAEAKVVRKTGEEMVVVGVEKTFENENGAAVIDRR